jgi:hypothetical protein
MVDATAPKTVTLPGGLKVNRNVLILLLITAGGLAAISWYRTRGDTGTTEAAVPGQIDPQTGYTYGSPEDQAALAAMAGSTLGQVDSSSWVGGQTIGYDQYGNPVYGQGGGGIPGAFTSNAQWTQSAEAYMGSDGNDAIAAALGKYITAQPLTEDQRTIVQSAIASQGYPPVAGPNGFPPAFRTQEAAPPGLVAQNPVHNLVLVPRYTQMDAHWNALKNAKTYTVRIHHNGKVLQTHKIAGTFTTFHNLRNNTSYTVTVWAAPGRGNSASERAKTL